MGSKNSDLYLIAIDKLETQIFLKFCIRIACLLAFALFPQLLTKLSFYLGKKILKYC